MVNPVEGEGESNCKEVKMVEKVLDDIEIKEV